MSILSALFGISGTEENMRVENEAKKMLIIDARSYAAAVANRAKGGGCECSGQLLG